MSALIEEFKKEHSEIIDTLKEIKELGVLSEKGQAKLISAKESLLEHLKKEDEQLYPFLKKEAEHSVKLKEILDVFAMDMENVSRVVMDFLINILKMLLIVWLQTSLNTFLQLFETG